MSSGATIRRATIVEPRHVEIIRTEQQTPPPGWALIKVESCGICGSDVTFYRGTHPVIKPPIALGHEVIGVVAELNDGAGSGYKAGDRVGFLPLVGCGKCSACRRGDARLCAQMKVIGGQLPGGMAESVIAPIENLVRVPNAVPEELRVLVEPLAVGVHAAGRAPRVEGNDCLVIGGGPIGLFLSLVLRRRGAQVTLVDTDVRRLEIATGLGLNALDSVPQGREPFDVVFDCVGGSAPARTALELVRADGAVILVGVAAAELTFSGIFLQRQERMLRGSNMYKRSEFEEAFDLLASGLIPTDAANLNHLLDRRKIDDLGEMLAALDKRSTATIKLVVDF